MKADEKLRIRDFIYLDVDRLKSIFSQVEEGLLVDISTTKAGQKEFEAAGTGKIPVLAELKGKGSLLWKNETTETRTLHDYMYYVLEEALLKKKAIIIFNDDFSPEDWDEGRVPKELADTSFFIARGQVLLNDYIYLSKILEEFNELGKFIGRCGTANIPSNLPKGVKKEAVRKVEQSVRMDDWLRKGLLKFVEVFYGERFLIKLLPFRNFVNIRLVGNLLLHYLRDNPRDIILKYGTAPVSEWVMFGQIAAIPPKDHTPFKLENFFGAEIDTALENVFGAFREIEKMALSISYPEIAVTPIAIYRE